MRGLPPFGLKAILYFKQCEQLQIVETLRVGEGRVL